MIMKDAIKTRHTVRKYTDKAIPASIIELLNARIAENNKTHGLNMALVVGNSDGLSAMAKVLLAKGVNNYIILAGSDTPVYSIKRGLKKTWVFILQGLMELLRLAMAPPKVFRINPRPQRRSVGITVLLRNGLPTV